MTAKDNARLASLENTDKRLQKVERRQNLDVTEPKIYSFQGHDPDTGKELIKSLGCCDCVGEGITATGDLLTNAGMQVGEVILSRQTGGFTRIDKKPVLADPSTKQPKDRNTGSFQIGQNPLDDDDTDDDEPTLEDPPKENEPVALSARCVGFAYVYEEYTGLLNDDGTFETRTVTIPNSPQCKSQTEPQSPINPEDDGCVKPGQPAKRCQFFDVTEAQAIAYQGCPAGMFNSGYQEFPDGYFKALCCSENGENVTTGIGRDWQSKNVIESGTALEGVNYCSGAFAGEIVIAGQVFSSSSPAISYSKSGNQIIVSDTSGAIGGYQLSDSDVVLESTSTAIADVEYCAGKPRARLRWNSGNIETTNTPIRYTLNANESCNATLGSSLGSISYLGNESAYTYPSFNFVAGQAYTIIVSGDYSFGDPNIRADGNYFTANNYATQFLSGAATDNTAGLDLSDPALPYNPAHVYQKCFISPLSGAIGFRCGDSAHGDNSGSVSVAFYEGEVNIEYTLTIRDLTGVIATYEYETEPTGFVVDCFDYAIAPQYVCRSNTKIC